MTRLDYVSCDWSECAAQRSSTSTPTHHQDSDAQGWGHLNVHALGIIGGLVEPTGYVDLCPVHFRRFIRSLGPVLAKGEMST